MRAGRLASLTLLFGLVFPSLVAAETLALPEDLISLDSEKGSQLLMESEALDAYWPLSIQFVTQENQAFCGVASIVMVLNALNVPAPETPAFKPFRTFTQENFFNDATEEIRPRETLARKGMTLDQLGGLIGVYALSAECITPLTAASRSFASSFRRRSARTTATS